MSCQLGGGGAGGEMLFSLPTRSMNTVFSCTLYDELFVQLSLLVPLLPEGYTAFANELYESSVRIPPPLASTIFKYEIESERQVCKSCTSCECISFLAEMFGYVLVSYGRERAKFWGYNSLECIELPKAYSISCSY